VSKKSTFLLIIELFTQLNCFQDVHATYIWQAPNVKCSFLFNVDSLTM